MLNYFDKMDAIDLSKAVNKLRKYPEFLNEQYYETQLLTLCIQN